jgi:SNF2 family DNA or RNA helicase
MKILDPTKEEWASGMVALRLSGISEQRRRELRWLDSGVVPYTPRGRVRYEYLVHVSSAMILMQHECFDGVQPQAKRIIKAWAHECKRTFTARKLKPEDDYDWAQHFTAECKHRDYQWSGMETMYRRAKVFHVGQVLGDDVGLGKTVQAIGVLGRWFTEGLVTMDRPAVIVTTTSSKSQWREEIERFTAHKLKVVSVDGGRQERIDRLETPAHVYVINYEMLTLGQYADALEPIIRNPGVLICDETYMVKNPAAKRTATTIAVAHNSARVIMFNATPIENGLADMWPQLFALEPNVFPHFAGFLKRYAVMGWDGRIREYQRVGEFKTRAAGLYIRRNRDEVGADLPSVETMYRPVEMGKEQTKAYMDAVGNYLLSSSGSVAMEALGRCVRVSWSADFEDGYSFHSAKCDDLLHLLEGELSGERLVLFTRSRQVAEHAAERLSQYKPLMITGKTSQRDRTLNRNRFNSPDGVGRLMICTEAGQRALNLQAAGVVGNLDLPWTPAACRQRIGRVARFGQSRKSVLCINWVAECHGLKEMPTVDRYFAETIRKKQDLFDRVFGADSVDVVGVKAESAVDHKALKAYLQVCRKSATMKP